MLVVKQAEEVLQEPPLSDKLPKSQVTSSLVLAFICNPTSLKQPTTQPIPSPRPSHIELTEAVCPNHEAGKVDGAD